MREKIIILLNTILCFLMDITRDGIIIRIKQIKIIMKRKFQIILKKNVKHIRNVFGMILIRQVKYR
jgi:hypothetical protein